MESPQNSDHQLDTTQYSVPVPPQTDAQKVSMLRAHPYTSIVVLAICVLLIGVFTVQRRTSVSPAGTTSAWGSATHSLTDPSYTPAQPDTQDQNMSILQQVKATAPYTYIPPDNTAPANTATDTGDSFDFEGFLTSITHPSGTSGTGGTAFSGSLQDAYSFIPTGMISTSTKGVARNKDQQALYLYGNEAGSYIQEFDTANPNMPQILKDQIEDRSNAQKNAAVAAIGTHFIDLAASLENIEDVPASAAIAHKALIASYREIGAKLQQVPAASGDAAFLQAIKDYDASADVFIKSYVSLAGVFSIAGVTFAEEDPGSVFTFSQSSGF